MRNYLLRNCCLMNLYNFRDRFEKKIFTVKEKINFSAVYWLASDDFRNLINKIRIVLSLLENFSFLYCWMHISHHWFRCFNIICCWCDFDLNDLRLYKGGSNFFCIKVESYNWISTFSWNFKGTIFFKCCDKHHSCWSPNWTFPWSAKNHENLGVEGS